MNKLQLPARISFSLVAAALCVATGCGQPTPQPADPDKARDALRVGLDAWKNGETAEALKQRSPPIYFKDLQWQAGLRLLDYKLEENGAERFGNSLHCPVVLSLEDKDGNKSQKKRTYKVNTDPNVVIVPADL